MKRTTLHIVVALLALGTFTATACAENWTAGMKEGKPAFKSMGPLAFGPGRHPVRRRHQGRRDRRHRHRRHREATAVLARRAASR